MKNKTTMFLYLALVVNIAFVGCSAHAEPEESHVDKPVAYGDKYVLTKDPFCVDLFDLGHVISLFSIDAMGNFVKVDYAPDVLTGREGDDSEPEEGDWWGNNNDAFQEVIVPDSYCMYPPNSWPLYSGKMLEYAKGFYWGWVTHITQARLSKHESYPIFYACRGCIAFHQPAEEDVTDEYRKGYENGKIHAQSDFEFYCRQIANGHIKHPLPASYFSAGR